MIYPKQINSITKKGKYSVTARIKVEAVKQIENRIAYFSFWVCKKTTSKYNDKVRENINGISDWHELALIIDIGSMNKSKEAIRPIAGWNLLPVKYIISIDSANSKLWKIIPE